MTDEDAPDPDDPYCSRRVDNEERWAFVRRHLDAGHDTLVDLGCAEGYFVDAAAAAGLDATGVEVKEDRYECALARYGDRENATFERRRITPETVADLPSADVSLVLTVHHHWVDAFGEAAATEMLRTVAEKTDLLCYEPPGTMFLGKPNSIDPAESVARYREYLLSDVDDRLAIRDVERFSHVDDEEWADRSDPLFVVDATDVDG